jgi:putative endonuclease
VKYRPTLIEAMTAIDTWKCQRVSRAARVWLTANPWAATLTLRGDAVYLAPRQWPRHAIAAVALDFD